MTPAQLAAGVLDLTQRVNSIFGRGATEDDGSEEHARQQQLLASDLKAFVGLASSFRPHLEQLGYVVPLEEFRSDGLPATNLAYLKNWQSVLAALSRYLNQPDSTNGRSRG